MKFYLFLIFNLYLLNALTLNKIKEVNAPSELKLIFNNNTFIELESEFIITKISWIRREMNKFNYLFGIFEGSNEPTFKNAIPLGIIKDDKSSDLINYININVTFSYKYIRYIPPNENNSDIFPITIYGFKKNEISEFLIDKKSFQITNLPLISIYTENSEEVTEKSIDLNCKILIVNDGKIEVNETAKIKVRDEIRAYLSPKFPYSIEFSTKQKILDFKGKYKKWELISNFFDRSLLRNFLALKISELMKYDYTVRCNPVDLILNGYFKGNYYICDKITPGKNRLNFKNIKKETDENYEGYLLEIDAMYYNGKKHFKSDNGIYVRILYPEEKKISIEQENYIINEFNKLENEIYNYNFDNLDLDSYSKKFIIEELCGDLEHLYSHYFLSKKKDKDKFYFGPVWDFETAFDNDKRLIPTNEKPNFCFNYYSASGAMKELTNILIENKFIMEYIKKTWDNLYKNVINEKLLLDIFEKEIKYIEESAKLNFLKWDNFVEEFDPFGPNYYMREYLFGRKGEDFNKAVSVLKDYIQNRFKTLSKLIKNALSLAK